MTDPKIKTKVVHSKTKPAYNVIGTTLGSKFKIARIPYLVDENLSEDWNNREMDEAKAHAEFISRCFNESERICSVFLGTTISNEKPAIDNVLLADALPPLNVVVEALFRYSKDWSRITGEKSVREEIKLTRRIAVRDNSRGWNWSHHEIKTTSTGEVVWWRLRLTVGGLSKAA